VISIIFVKGLTIFTMCNLESPDVFGPGSEPRTSSLIPAVLCTAAQSQS